MMLSRVGSGRQSVDRPLIDAAVSASADSPWRPSQGRPRADRLATACDEVSNRPDRLDDEGKHPSCLWPADLVSAAARKITKRRQRHHRLEGATHADGTLLHRREVRPLLLRHGRRVALLAFVRLNSNGAERRDRPGPGRIAAGPGDWSSEQAGCAPSTGSHAQQLTARGKPACPADGNGRRRGCGRRTCDLGGQHAS